jgi:hypothetical protein
MQPTIKHYINPMAERFTEFPMLFNDGEVKPAYLMSSIGKLLSTELSTDNLRDLGLVDGVDFLVKNTTALPDGVVDLNALDVVNGKRTVVSLAGVIKVVIRSRGDYSDRIVGWLSNRVIPKALKAYPTMHDNTVLTMFRYDLNRMADLTAEEINGAGDEYIAALVPRFGKQTIIGAVIIAAVTTTVVIIVKRKRNKKVEMNRSMLSC